jgi:DNA-binding response OmpR family regulator
MRILVIEDERHMAALLRKGLEEEGYAVSVAYDGNQGREAASRFEFDAIVLDVMLPYMNGYEVARHLRQHRRHTPILMLTARDAEADVIRGLNLGADDYLTKPFSFEVLLARLRAITRRAPILQPEELRVGGIVLVPSTHDVSCGGERISLTRTEFNLLEYLMRRPGRVASRRSLIEAVWGFDREVEGNTLDAFISLLRRKIDGERKVSLIRTVRGVGYTLGEESEP